MTLRQSLVTLVKIRGPAWLRAFLRKSMGTIKNVLPLHAAAWKATSGPIQQLLSTRNVTEQDDLTRLWRENTSSQLNVVCITVQVLMKIVDIFMQLTVTYLRTERLDCRRHHKRLHMADLLS